MFNKEAEHKHVVYMSMHEELLMWFMKDGIRMAGKMKGALTFL